MKEVNTKSPLFKISLLSISILCMVAASVSTVIPAMAKTITTVSLTQIEFLASIPNFGILLFVLLSPIMTKKFGDKKSAMLGILIVLVAGITPAFTNNYNVILFSRFLLGCGVGMFNSQAYSLIAIYYDGDERTRLLGYQNAISALGNTILTFLVGILLKQGWHTTYLVYLAALIPLILFGLFVPETPKNLVQTSDSVKNKNIHLSKYAIGYSIYAFVIYACYMTIIYKIATLVIEKGYASASEAGYVLSIGSALGFISGLLFIYVAKIFNKQLLPICLIAIGLCFAGIWYSNSLILTGILVIIAGAFFGWGASSVFNNVAQKTNAASQNLASSVLLVGINLGCFANPTIMNIIGKILGTQKADILVLAAGIILLVCGIIHYMFGLSQKDIIQEQSLN